MRAFLKPHLSWRSAFARNCEGTAAVEFALIAPLLVTMFLGTYELTNLLIANMKVDAATQTAADLVARTSGSTTILTSTDLSNIGKAASDVMMPLSGGPLTVAFASITYNTGSPVIDWHYEYNGASKITLTSAVTSMLNGLGTTSSGSTDSVILVETNYAYTSPISYVLSKTYNFTGTAADRPRFVACVISNVNNSSTTKCP